jgi:hypothetical protein
MINKLGYTNFDYKKKMDGDSICKMIKCNFKCNDCNVIPLSFQLNYVVQSDCVIQRYNMPGVTGNKWLIKTCPTTLYKVTIHFGLFKIFKSHFM